MDSSHASNLGRSESDVLFAYMPYHRLTHPALGASILKTCLNQQGISARVAYLGLDFAEQIGTTLYNSLLNSRTPLLQAEWTFASAAFGEAFIKEREAQIGRPYPWATADIKKAAKQAENWILKVVDGIASNPPRIIICSSMFQQNLASLAVLRGIKERCPNIFTIMGGPNTEGILGIGLLRRAPWLDYVSSGEGEETLPELCKLLLTGSHQEKLPVGVNGQADLERLKGLYEININRATLTNMNNSPVPCFDDYFSALKQTQINIEPGLLLESSRGCWWGQRSHCTFCGLNGDGMNFRARDPKKMASIVFNTTKKYAVKKIEFVDNIIAKNYFEEFLPLIEGEDLSIFYETKADFSESDVKRFRDSGVRFIQPGIESLSTPVLKLMRKGTSSTLNLECLRLCREYGIKPSWSILSGFPGEQEIWYAEMLSFMPKLFHLSPPNGFIPIRYDRFSPYHDHPEQWGLELEPFEAYLHIYPDYLGRHDDVAYFFKRRGRDELKDDGLGIWSQTHWNCRQTVKVWKEFWSERSKDGVSHPELYLYHDLGWKIHDDRNPQAPACEYNVSEQMAELLIYCRQRRSNSILRKNANTENLKIDNNQLDDLLQEALERGWLISIDDVWLSLVQIFNHQQVPIKDWPGGLILPAKQPSIPHTEVAQGNVKTA